MNPLPNILTVARFEFIVLLRSWTFRLFALLSMIVIGFLDYIFFVRSEMPWMLNALPSFVPYLNLLLLSVVQAVIGVLLASEFLKNDLKLDMTEVIYPHSMTNAAYVLGKMTGVLGVFCVLNILILSPGLIINTFHSELPVSIKAYLWYPLLISLPTLVFLFGLSALLMALVRNQALTIVLLLGLIALTLFYPGESTEHIFDFPAFKLPLVYSDFVGFGNLKRLLIQRGIYFLLGLGFTFLAALLLRRLPQSRRMTGFSQALAVACIGGALYLGWIYVHGITEEEELRGRMSTLDRQLSRSPMVSMTRCDLEVTHGGRAITATARLRLANRTAQTLDSYVLSLNPGLHVNKVERAGQALPFERDLHILTVKPPEALAPGAEDSLTLQYQGPIDERVCYPDIDSKTRAESYRILFYNIDKRHAFVQPDYVLLTPECLWYPRAGLTEGAAWPETPPRDFPEFSLKVKTRDGLRAISQGAVTDNGGGEFVFAPETPLSQLSLAIGRYERRSITVDDTVTAGDSTTVERTDYSIYYLRGHDFFPQYFTGIDSALPGIIRTARIEYENRIGLKYPYRRLMLVETPLQFFTCRRTWTLGHETAQPELLFMPEKAAMWACNFGMMSYFMNRGAGGKMSAEEIRKNMFQQFIDEAFLTSPIHPQGIFTTGFLNTKMSELFNLSNCSVFPLFHSHLRHVSSEKWPLLNLALEYYLNQKMATEQVMSTVQARGMQGLAAEDRANLALAERSLAEILANPLKEDDVRSILKVKCGILFNYIRCRAGGKDFKAFMKSFLEGRTFSDIKGEELIDSLSQRCGEDLGPFLDTWLRENKLPAYVFGSPRMHEIIDGNKTRYQILFSITNDGVADGLIGVNFVWSASSNFEKIFGSRPENQADERFYTLKAGQSKEIGIVLDEKIHKLWLNTCLSQNLPGSLALSFVDVKPEPGAKPFEGERVLTEPVVREEPGVIVVDNEDPGFEVQKVETDSFLKKMMKRSEKKQKDYAGLVQYNLPVGWNNTLFGNFFGRYRHSGHCAKAGDGKFKVAWKADLPRNGRYELCYNVVELPARNIFRPSRGEEKSRVQDFHFTVHEDDGARELDVDLSGVEPGWYSLGTFYFSKGSARVELTDKSKGELLYADAVRWTLRE